jgi:hypothetical protein
MEPSQLPDPWQSPCTRIAAHVNLVYVLLHMYTNSLNSFSYT